MHYNFVSDPHTSGVSWKQQLTTLLKANTLLRNLLAPWEACNRISRTNAAKLRVLLNQSPTSNLGPKVSESSSFSTSLQNAANQNHPSVSTTRQLVHHSGPERHMLSYQNSTSTQKILKIFLQKTMCIRAALAPLCQAGVRVLNYLDDWHGSESQALAYTSMFSHHLSELGLTMNLENSFLVPIQCVHFLGLTLDTQILRATLSPERMVSLTNCCFDI